jgi:hypothetical protein
VPPRYGYADTITLLLGLERCLRLNTTKILAGELVAFSRAVVVDRV